MNKQGTRQPRGRRTGISLATVMLCWMTVLLCIPALRAASITPAFTYQGNLSADGAPANGLYDFRFTLHDSLNGSAIGTPITNSPVVVTQGHFTVLLDFGPDAFTGAERWIEIGARTNGTLMDFTTLAPRQALTPTPHSIVASQLAGPLPSGLLSGDYTSPVTITNAANVLGGDGAGLTGLNASQITTGTLADARLSANVALLNRTNQAFTGINTFAGNVGIGTTSPLQPLHIANGGTTAAVRVENLGNANTAINLVNSDRNYEVRLQGADQTFRIRDLTENAARMTITTNGNIGIGTTAPLSALHVVGDQNDGTNAAMRIVSGAGASQRTLFVGGDAIDSSGALDLNKNTGKKVSVGGDLSVVGSLSAASISGDGAGLTGLDSLQLLDRTNVAILSRKLQEFAGTNSFAERVGIGTSSPFEKLHILSTGTPTVRVEHSGGGAAAVALVNSNRTYDLRIHTDDTFRVRDGTATRLTIATNGNVGIGTANPADTLHVNGGVTATTFTGNGAGLTGVSVSASEITSGTLADAQLGLNVALLNRNNQAFTGDNLFSGKVGVGTTTPSQKLHVVAGSATEVRVENTGSGSAALGLVNADREYSLRMTGTESFVVRDVTDGNADRLTIATNGNVGIGTTSPKQALHVNGDYYGKGHFYLHAYEGDGVNGTAYVQARDDSGSSSIGLKFRTQKEGNIVEAMQLGWDGITYVNVLTITGGADIAEPFHVHSSEDIVPGMVVSIDPDRTGELRLSSRAYDHTVAGIISGAGGVKPGMTLQQTGTLADGKHPVALTGRVWCNVDADSASVKPGDLLTTSDTPGHAMKALDHGRAQGAIIGKAMTKLDSGRGLVLVLVSLQ